MLNAVRNTRLKKTFQTLVYMPHFVSWVVVAGLVFSLVDFESGAVTNLIRFLTGKKVDVLSSPSAFLARHYRYLEGDGLGRHYLSRRAVRHFRRILRGG